MKETMMKWINKELVKFFMASGIATVLDIGLFTLLVYLLKEAAPVWYIFIATVISRTTSLLVSYYLNKTFVFKQRNDRTCPLLNYLSLGLSSMLASAIIVTLFSRMLPANETRIKIFVDTILFWLGYFIQKIYIF